MHANFFGGEFCDCASALQNRQGAFDFDAHGHVRFVEEVPTMLIGKIQKFVMRQRMIGELQLNEQKTT